MEASELSNIQFGLMTNGRMKQYSAMALTTIPTSQRKKHSHVSTVNDPRLGTISEHVLCSQCGNTIDNCPGHYGTLPLIHPVINANFLSTIHKILSSICIRCSALLVDPDHYRLAKIRKISSYKKRINEIFNLALKRRVCQGRTKEKVLERLSPEEAHRRGYCGATQPCFFTRDVGVLIRPVYIYNTIWDNPSPKSYQNIPTISHALKQKSYYGGNGIGVAISNQHMYTMLKNVTSETCELFGFDPIHSPLHCMIFKNLLIPPLLVRPRKNLHTEDDLTVRLRQIQKINNISGCATSVDMSLHFDMNGCINADILMSKKHTHNKKGIIPQSLDEIFNLQRHISGFQDAKYFVPLDCDYGRERCSIKSRFMASKSKRGRLRNNCLGKRGDFTARYVATPNTYIMPNEIGVPIDVLCKLTFPEIVNKYNINIMLGLVLRGRKYPGANFVQRGGIKYMVEACLDGLKIGDIVHRHLQKGDYILANRQPTLHRFSLLAYSIVPIHASTLQLHLAVTTATNLDFDGDELNVFALGSLTAVAEARELMSVERNMFNNGKLLIGFVQHACLGAYKLTQAAPTFTKMDAMQLLYGGNDDIIFSDVVERLPPQQTYSGREIVQAMLPPYPGILPLTKKTLSHVAYLCLKTYVPHIAIRILGFCTRVFEEFIVCHGSSISVSDCVIPRNNISTQINSIISCVDELWEDRKSIVDITPEDKSDVEEKISILLDRVRDIAGDYVTDKLHTRGGHNGLLDVTFSGAKGNVTHITQNSGMVGQQMDKNARRHHDSTSHIYPDHATKYGFVKSAFVDCLTATEYFHHLRSSRNGLIATAVSTAETGYVYRKMCKWLEDVVIAFDCSVRMNSNGLVLDGHFGFDSTHLQYNPIRFVTLNETQLIRVYTRSEDNGDNNVEVQQLLSLRRRILRDKTPRCHALMPLDMSQLGDLIVDKVKGPVSIAEAVHTITILWQRMVTMFHVPNDLYTEACFFDWFSVRNLQHINALSNGHVFDKLLELIFTTLTEQVVQQDTPIGLMVSQGFSQPLTQLNLDTFHISGEKIELTDGVTRIKEILNVTKNIHTVSMTIFEKQGMTIDPFSLIELHFKDIFDCWQDEIPIDITREKSQIGFLNDRDDSTLVRLVLILQRALLITRKITPRMIAGYLQKSRLFSRYQIHIAYSDVTSDIWWVSIVLPDDSTFIQNKFPTNTPKPLMVMHIQYMLKSENVLITGIKNIKDFVMKTKDVYIFNRSQNVLEKQTRQTIVTIGSNLADICCLPNVDIELTTTNDIVEIFETLGIDACENAIEQNLADVLLYNQASVSRKHIKIIATVMCCSGTPIPLNYTGMKSVGEDISTLKLATFERSYDSFLSAGITGYRDNLKGVSESILTGKKIDSGTGGNFTLKQRQEYLKYTPNIEETRHYIGYGKQIPPASLDHFDNMLKKQLIIPINQTTQKTKKRKHIMVVPKKNIKKPRMETSPIEVIKTFNILDCSKTIETSQIIIPPSPPLEVNTMKGMMVVPIHFESP